MLIKRCVVPGQAYAVTDVDNPRGGALAVALRAPDGWKVASTAGVLAIRLEQRAAIALMMRTAIHAAGRTLLPTSI